MILRARKWTIAKRFKRGRKERSYLPRAPGLLLPLAHLHHHSTPSFHYQTMIIRLFYNVNIVSFRRRREERRKVAKKKEKPKSNGKKIKREKRETECRGRRERREMAACPLRMKSTDLLIPIRTSMMLMWSKVIALAVLSVLVVVRATPLDDYVNKPDNTYQWETVNSVRGLDFTAYNIKLTSQTWMSQKEVSISVWTHWLQICVPDNVRKRKKSFFNSSPLSSLHLHPSPLFIVATL